MRYNEEYKYKYLLLNQEEHYYTIRTSGFAGTFGIDNNLFGHEYITLKEGKTVDIPPRWIPLVHVAMQKRKRQFIIPYTVERYSMSRNSSYPMYIDKALVHLYYECNPGYTIKITPKDGNTFYMNHGGIFNEWGYGLFSLRIRFLYHNGRLTPLKCVVKVARSVITEPNSNPLYKHIFHKIIPDLLGSYYDASNWKHGASFILKTIDAFKDPQFGAFKIPVIMEVDDRKKFYTGVIAPRPGFDDKKACLYALSNINLLDKV